MTVLNRLASRQRLRRGSMRIAGVVGLIAALIVLVPNAGRASAAEASSAGDVISIGDPDAPGQIELYLDPMCPYSGKLIRDKGGEIGRRLEAGKLHIDLRFVNFLEKYSASGTYDSRSIYAAYVVANDSQSSGITWRFIQQIYAADNQPHEKGDSDLDNDQLAELARQADASPFAQDQIRWGLHILVDPDVVAANNLALLHQFPDPGVPLVVINGHPVDDDSNWLKHLPR